MPLAPLAATYYALSIDVGGTFSKLALVDNRGRICHRERVPSAGGLAPSEVPTHVAHLARQALQGSEAWPESRAFERGLVAGICLAIPGIVDERSARIISCPNLSNWDGLQLGRLVAAELSLPVYLVNDGNAAVLGERWMGAGRGVDDLIGITIGTGIGCGLVLRGELYAGALGGAGEISHTIVDRHGPPCTCGQRGCLETYASARAIAGAARRAVEQGRSSELRNLAGGDPAALTAEHVFAAAQAGDDVANEIVAEAIAYLGISLANVVNLFNPSMIVIGGGMAQAGERLLEPLREMIHARGRTLLTDHCQVVLAQLGADAGVIGGAYVVFRGQGVPC